MADWLMSILTGIPLSIRIIILSCLPITELRGAIPVGIALGIPPVKTFFLGVMGNLVPVIPLLLVMPRLYAYFERNPSFRRHWGRMLERTRKKGRQVEKYGALGLLLFVAIPLPGTGVWTGSLLAFIMGINFWYSVIALTGGAFLAGIAVTVASIGFIQMYKYLFDLEVLAAVVLVLIVTWWMIKRWRRKI